MVFCEACRKNDDRIKVMRNYSNAFVKGVCGIGIKKDNVGKHAKSAMHRFSIIKPVANLTEFFNNTPIGQSMGNASDATKKRVEKLVDVSYFVAKEEMAYSKYPKIVELEIRHGVDMGSSYHSVMMCKELTKCIAKEYETNLSEILQKTLYISAYADGSTDVNTTEKELTYAGYIDPDSGVNKLTFVTLQDLKTADATGITDALQHALAKNGVDCLKNKLVGFMADGANVNLGHKKGIAALLRKECPWFIAVHCFSHRLELSVKDCISATQFEDILKLMEDLHSLYEKSSKRIREFHELAKVLGQEKETTSKPAARVYGTQWVAHTKQAVDVFEKTTQ